MRRLCVAAVYVIAALLPTQLSAAAAGEGGDLIGKVCGDAAAMGDAGRALTHISADGSLDDRAWAASIARALIDRKLSCDASGAVVVAAEGSLDAATRVQRNAGEASRSPLLSLTTRPVFEIAQPAPTFPTPPH